jgi:peptidoglycan/LPS O-acetylase OafA/YrhL
MNALEAGSPANSLAKPVRGHIVELDALRGVAAIIVVLDHFLRFWGAAQMPAWLARALTWPVVRIFCDGAAAVMVFFLLSGFVLALPSLRGRSTRYPVYVLRRVCRIYLPYVVALAIGILVAWMFHDSSGYGGETRAMWRGAPDVHSVLQHILFVGQFNVLRYDPPIWSLVHEMRISLVFPLLCLIALRLQTRYALLVSVLFPIGARVIEKLHPSAPSTLGEGLVLFTSSLSYCGVFLLGALIAKHQDYLRYQFVSLRAWGQAALLLVAGWLYLYPWRDSGYIQSLGGACLIVAALSDHGWFARLLRTRPLQFLGRVSYSLYLLHLPLLLVLSIAVYRKFPYGFLLPPYLCLCLAAAALFYRWVEVPSIALGKNLGGRLAARLG